MPLLPPIIFLIFPIILAAVAPENNDGGRLRMGAALKVAVFADLHFGEDAWTAWGPQQDLDSVRVMSTVLDQEHPDFVIYLGDVITANNVMTKNATSYWDQALSPARDRGIPYSSVFGNHDDAAFEWPLEWFSDAGIPEVHCPESKSGDECSFRGTARLELSRSEIQCDPTLSYTKGGPKTLWPSVSNYVLKILSPGDDEEDVLHMYFFDSGGGSYPEVISNAQVKWFQQESQKINPGSRWMKIETLIPEPDSFFSIVDLSDFLIFRVPEVIFWHIPSKAYEVASKQRLEGRCVGSIFLEDVAAQEEEMGMMRVLEERASVKDTTTDSIGVVLTRAFGYALLATLATVDTGHGLEGQDFWKLTGSRFP
ncbi:probable inactive purple acid phosphatase 16 isoform X2 [Andrographis paniculata]|uniref:probable inactive purple acid phosphatase 16 isoform X2 n=1 Tax=Andrographis paniculata TaxID=175694 RepID=UPI0021E820E3|nr:probable inactive purple acid phosphatase 16 isoform X2 [Andrographis paniculata]